MNEVIQKKILQFQRNEITEHHIYANLARAVRDPENKKILERISKEELEHYQFWKSLTAEAVAPDRGKVWKHVLISKVFGLTFGLKQMEKGEKNARHLYDEVTEAVPHARKIEQDEEQHENAILGMIKEEKLQYIGSAVLGLSDALVELTGALAGFTLALQNNRIVAAAGLITGLAASFSMAASEYLSTKSESFGKSPLKASFYTGTAYLFTVLFLIFPFLAFNHLLGCLILSLTNAVIVILLFTYYISVVQDLSFKKRFFEMAGISLGVALLTFVLGFVIRVVFKIDI